MSYILEALDKAEAERALGEVPGLHAPAAASTLTPAPAAWRRWLPGLALAAVLLIAAVVFWNRQPAAVIAAAPAAAPAAASAPVASAAASAAALAPVAPPALPAPVRPAEPLPPLATRAPSPVGATKTARPAPAVESLRLKKSALPAAASAADERLPTLRELPEPIQHEIPALSVGGYIYSDNRAERSLLLNNKLLREGDEVAAGLRLEKMLPGAAVLNYKGYRYRIAY